MARRTTAREKARIRHALQRRLAGGWSPTVAEAADWCEDTFGYRPKDGTAGRWLTEPPLRDTLTLVLHEPVPGGRRRVKLTVEHVPS